MSGYQRWDPVGTLGSRWVLNALSRYPPLTLDQSATIFELVLFSLVMYKCAVSSSAHLKLNGRASLINVLIHENTLYFFVWVK